MSKLSGLSVISKDTDNINTAVRFINIENTNSNEPIFISGTAIDNYAQNGDITNSDINYIAHGKFSKLSLINNSMEAVADSSNIQKGEENYIYIDKETGQLKTASFNNLFDNHILKLNVDALVLRDSSNLGVSLSGDELKQLKLLISP